MRNVPQATNHVHAAWVSLAGAFILSIVAVLVYHGKTDHSTHLGNKELKGGKCVTFDNPEVCHRMVKAIVGTNQEGIVVVLSEAATHHSILATGVPAALSEYGSMVDGTLVESVRIGALRWVARFRVTPTLEAPVTRGCLEVPLAVLSVQRLADFSTGFDIMPHLGCFGPLATSTDGGEVAAGGIGVQIPAREDGHAHAYESDTTVSETVCSILVHPSKSPGALVARGGLVFTSSAGLLAAQHTSLSIGTWEKMVAVRSRPFSPTVAEDIGDVADASKCSMVHVPSWEGLGILQTSYRRDGALRVSAWHIGWMARRAWFFIALLSLVLALTTWILLLTEWRVMAKPVHDVKGPSKSEMLLIQPSARKGGARPKIRPHPSSVQSLTWVLATCSTLTTTTVVVCASGVQAFAAIRVFLGVFAELAMSGLGITVDKFRYHNITTLTLLACVAASNTVAAGRIGMAIAAVACFALGVVLPFNAVIMPGALLWVDVAVVYTYVLVYAGVDIVTSMHPAIPIAFSASLIIFGVIPLIIVAVALHKRDMQ